MVTKEYSEAVVEVLDILQYTADEDVKKIPIKLLKFFERVKSNKYISKIDNSKPLNEQELKPKTKEIIAMLYRNYWCTEEEREEYDKILISNDKKYEQELKEKYNQDNIFKNRKNKQNKKYI